DNNAPTSFTIGTGPGQVQWNGDGGFAAITGARTLTLNGGAPLTWGAGGFVPSGNALILSTPTSNQTLTLPNAIDLGSATRSAIVSSGFLNTPGATLSGVLSGAGAIEFTGSGTVSLTGANTHAG